MDRKVWITNSEKVNIAPRFRNRDKYFIGLPKPNPNFKLTIADLQNAGMVGIYEIR